MGRIYAGVLGFLAFATALARGMIDSQGVGATVGQACVALAVFAAVGGVAGTIAETAVWDSVEQNLKSEIEAQRREASNEH